MRIHLVGRTVEIDDGLHGFVERQLILALGRVSSNIHCAIVRLCDLNGPRGSMDKTCRIEVRLRSRRSLVVEYTDVSLYAAISQAADGAGRAVVQVKERCRRHRRATMPAEPRRHSDQAEGNNEDPIDTREVAMEEHHR